MLSMFISISLLSTTADIVTCLLNSLLFSYWTLLNFLSKLSRWEKEQKSIYIYYFSLQKNSDLEKVQQKISYAKKKKIAQRAYPRINDPSRYLYVGSSRNIAKRIREHLGFGYRTTYAMNLAFWCKDLDLEIDIVCMRYNPQIEKEIIQAFEDGLWDYLKPLLGRQGVR